MLSQTLDDKDLDDDALWAAIDSAAATRPLKPQNNNNNNNNNNNRFQSPKVTFPVISKFTSSPTITNPRKHSSLSNNEEDTPTPKKIARFSLVQSTSPLAIVNHVQRTPITPSSHRSDYQIHSPLNSPSDCSLITHSLSGRFPTVGLFKEYQNAAMAILEKGDYTMISGNQFIKKSGWRKISFYFNISYEIKDKTIEFDDNRNVQRAEFIVRAHMQGGRFSDGWGSCDRREKRFLKPNHDIPSTAETRAKNKACQDLLGIGEYRPGVSAQR